jgi:hypothetical protein
MLCVPRWNKIFFIIFIIDTNKINTYLKIYKYLLLRKKY